MPDRNTKNCKFYMTEIKQNRQKSLFCVVVDSKKLKGYGVAKNFLDQIRKKEY